jgi:adenylate cyclase, class 2
LELALRTLPLYEDHPSGRFYLATCGKNTTLSILEIVYQLFRLQKAAGNVPDSFRVAAEPPAPPRKSPAEAADPLVGYRIRVSVWFVVPDDGGKLPPLLKIRITLQQRDFCYSFLFMPQETEIKLRIENLKSFLRSLKKLGARPFASRVHEQNLLFDTPDGGLAKHGQLLRIRTETPAPGSSGRSKSQSGGQTSKKTPSRILLTFKSPPEQMAIGPAASLADRRYKVREEIELVLTDGEALRKIFEGLGLKGWFRYEKFRTAYRLPARTAWAKGLIVDVEETPIGTFVELEGPGPAIDRAARELGFSPGDYVLKNYLVLYVEECKRRGVAATHMLFGESSR